MIDHVVVDVEIENPVEDTPGGWDATDKLGVAVACVWEYRTARMRVYGPKDVEELRGRLMRADRVSGYNIWKFDFPVIWGLPGRERVAAMAPRTDDLLRRIWIAAGQNPDIFNKTTHGGYGLEAVATDTLGVGKIGYGGDAPDWYRQGLVQKVVNYCADDVALERDLTDFIDRHGYAIGPRGKLFIDPWTSTVPVTPSSERK